MNLQTLKYYYEKFVDQVSSHFRNALRTVEQRIPSPTFFQPILLILLSAVLLILSFPKYDFWVLTWIGLVPFMYVLDGKKPGRAFRWGYVLGLLFFAGTLYWFIYVTVLGAILLIMYLALYFGLFGLGYAFFAKRKLIVKLFVYPSLWVALEYLRGHLLTGFGWASLAHSQYKNLLSIQIADVTGMLGVSFLIVMVNYFLKEFIVAYRNHERDKPATEMFIACAVCICLLNFNLVYGFLKINRSDDKKDPSIYAAVIQGNIPLTMRWNKSAWPYIVDKYIQLTKHAIAKEPHLIDLVIWPETAYPGYLWEEKRLLAKVKKELEPYQKPLLFGAVTKRNDDYFNSAILVAHNQERPLGQYNKLHLVPFGEYIPYRKYFPFLKYIIPIDDFTPGEQRTVFKFNNKRNTGIMDQVRFSVLVCFEDAIAWIARRFTRDGANFLVNITNDAWFRDTKAPWMHVQSSVFRAIENRKSVVRAANTGVSCFVDRYGRIYGSVVNSKDVKTFVAGYSWGRISLNNIQTFYVRYGDVFIFLCFVCVIGAVLSSLQRRHSRE